MKKSIATIGMIFFVIIAFVSGFFLNEFIPVKDNSNKDTSSQTSSSERNTPDQKNEYFVEQENFENWASNFTKIEFNDYKFSEDLSFFGTSARVMDKELSFNKREILTTTGDIDFIKNKSTEKVFAYVNGSKTFSIALMINESNIGENFQGSDWLYMNKDVYAVPLIMSYKNVIILTTLQDNKNYVDYSEAINLSKIVLQNISNDGMDLK